MGLTNVLFGRKRLKKAVQEKLFAITTARITLETDLGLKPTGDSAVIFKPLSAAEFVRAENELQELLDVAAADSHSKIERRGDEFGYEWLIIRDNDFEELVATVHMVASELVARGFGEQLLAAAFKFRAASIRSTGSTASSVARSGRSSRPVRTRSATTPRSSS